VRYSVAPVALAALLAVGVLATPVAADGGAAVDEAIEDGDAAEAVETYNDNVDRVPEFVRDRLAGERVVVTVERSDAEDAVYTVVTDESARVESYRTGAHDPTVRVTTDEATVREVAAADDPESAALEAYRSDAVTVEGVGAVNAIEVETAKLGYDLGASLDLL